MKKCEILVRDCRILKPDMQLSELCSVAIDGTKIEKIGPTQALLDAYAPQSVLDGSGKLMLPGFIDGHVHVNAATADLGALEEWRCVH